MQMNEELEKSLLKEAEDESIKEKRVKEYLNNLLSNQHRIAPPKKVGFFRRKWFCPRCGEQLFPTEYQLTFMTVMNKYLKCKCGYERVEGC